MEKRNCYNFLILQQCYNSYTGKIATQSIHHYFNISCCTSVFSHRILPLLEVWRIREGNFDYSYFIDYILTCFMQLLYIDFNTQNG